MYLMCNAYKGQKRTLYPLELEIQLSYECWESNPGLLEEHFVLLITEACLQPQEAGIFIIIIIIIIVRTTQKGIYIKETVVLGLRTLSPHWEMELKSQKPPDHFYCCLNSYVSVSPPFCRVRSVTSVTVFWGISNLLSSA